MNHRSDVVVFDVIVRNLWRQHNSTFLLRAGCSGAVQSRLDYTQVWTPHNFSVQLVFNHCHNENSVF